MIIIICLGFPVTSYGKTQMNFLANSIFWGWIQQNLWKIKCESCKKNQRWPQDFWPDGIFCPPLYPGVFPGGASGKECSCQCKKLKRHRFNSRFKKSLWRRKWQPTPVFLPEESHGQRSLMGYMVHRVAKNQTQLKWFCMHAVSYPLPWKLTELGEGAARTLTEHYPKSVSMALI